MPQDGRGRKVITMVVSHVILELGKERERERAKSLRDVEKV